MAPVGVCIIGFGITGQTHAHAIVHHVPSLKIEIVCDLSEAAMRAAIARIWDLPTRTMTGLPPPRATTDMREALADPAIGAVTIALPHHLHSRVALAAIAAGKHVLLEKPLGLDEADARTIHDAALAHERAGKVVMVDLTHRFYAPCVAARALVRSGRLGDVWMVQDKIMCALDPTVRSWLHYKKTAGGGVALCNGIHMLDRMAWIAGGRLRFEHGTAQAVHMAPRAGVGDTEDTVTMALTLALPGGREAPASLLASWYVRYPRTPPPYDRAPLTIAVCGSSLQVPAGVARRAPRAGRRADAVRVQRHAARVGVARVAVRAARRARGGAPAGGRRPRRRRCCRRQREQRFSQRWGGGVRGVR